MKETLSEGSAFYADLTVWINLINIILISKGQPEGMLLDVNSIRQAAWRGVISPRTALVHGVNEFSRNEHCSPLSSSPWVVRGNYSNDPKGLVGCLLKEFTFV